MKKIINTQVNSSFYKLLSALLFISVLNACSSGRYADKHDSTPTRLPNQAEQKDAIARAEPHSRGGNKDYQVFGKPYKVMNSAQGFQQTGTASWYGNKFHGHYTSNGEIYDMYTMSAAHKNLPLPTYVKVTNTANNKSVIVRVNDRGPFHESRIIDLSYSAAYKLDMLKTGTAEVHIEAITEFDLKTGLVKLPSDDSLLPEANSTVINNEVSIAVNDTGTTPNELITVTSMGIATPYIQVLATSNKQLAIETAEQLTSLYKQATSYPEQDGLYRIQIGPINDLTTLNTLLSALKENGYPNAYPRSSTR
ncbi:septal ring lytic transglycosylase RlpA family protein [Colwellia echini]|uniref:Endolytic peptidoglycan transglycosylase RlpA n=1 Tax=Colwellia echini TaxID=1982103 RepID=A0ABY3MT53_9GAMM|nr:septal ring lytic transglycosylase RlpA family protein [Colwellia echini]TYK64370.1 septal ring lytic transglycosylase RlpA family protein [Colwellia echini]